MSNHPKYPPKYPPKPRPPVSVTATTLPSSITVIPTIGGPDLRIGLSEEQIARALVWAHERVEGCGTDDDTVAVRLTREEWMMVRNAVEIEKFQAGDAIQDRIKPEQFWRERREQLQIICDKLEAQL